MSLSERIVAKRNGDEIPKYPPPLACCGGMYAHRPTCPNAAPPEQKPAWVRLLDKNAKELVR